MAVFEYLCVVEYVCEFFLPPSLQMTYKTSKGKPLTKCGSYYKAESRRKNICSWQEKWIYKSMLAILFVVAFALLVFIVQPFNNEIYVLGIRSKSTPLYTTNEKYLSVALDSSLIADDFKGFNISDIRLIKVMRAVSGGYLRLGGRMADRLIFRINSNYMSSIRGDPFFILTGYKWKLLNRLAARTGFTILFDLNSMIRNEDGSWNTRNAEDLIEFSNNYGFNVIWQLGNEPNDYKHVFDYTVNASQLAADFKRLRTILQRYPRYSKSLLVGPDISRPKLYKSNTANYLCEFLGNLDYETIDAITWHQYYFKSSDAYIYYFVNPDVFNLLKQESAIIKSIAEATGFEGKPIWLGETASAYGGGAEGLSDTFIGTFIWLDKLGLAAKNGIDLVIRQSLFKGYYALISNDDYNPNPDWWVSVLYKLLVGNRVVECLLVAPPELRLYCHCTAQNNNYVKEPSITVYGVNLKSYESVIRLEEMDTTNLKQYQVIGFILTPHISYLSKYVLLNDMLLRLKNYDLPPLKPFNLTTNIIKLPPYSLGFWIITGVNFPVCN